jgi:cytoskeletal protein RodZ
VTAIPESFGARLRQRREERQIDLIAIAEQTKIKLALLQALERDDVSQWPAGIFRRAYIRTYAHAVGLEPDAVLREFLEVHPEPADVFTATTAAAAAAEEASRKNAPPPTRLWTMVDSAIGSLARLRRPATGDDLPAAGPPANERTGAGGDRSPVASRGSVEHEMVVTGTAETPGANPAADPVPATTADPVPATFADTADAFAAETADARPAETADSVPAEAAAVPPAEATTGGSTSPDEAAALESRLDDVAQLCTALGQAASGTDIQRLLSDAARLLDATGLIVWLWDELAGELRPVLVHGYSDRVLAHLPTVKRDADNATAAAFRSGATCAVAASAHATAALVVPLLDPEGCGGVLAIEMQPGITPAGAARAVARLLAAALAQLVYRSQPAARHSDVEPPLAAAEPGPPRPPIKVRR